MRSHARGSRLRALLLALLLVVYGNGKARILGDSPAGSRLGVGFGVALVGLMAVWARWLAHMQPAELGISRSSLGTSARWGFGSLVVLGGAASVGIALLGPARVLAGFPASVRALPAAAIVRRVTLLLPFDTVIPEELAFRGVLQAELRRLNPPWLAVLLTSGVFGLWHVTITLGETSPSQPFAIAGKLAGDAAFGLGFGFLRQKTNNLLGSGIVHWAADAVGMLLVLILD